MTRSMGYTFFSAGRQT